MLKEIMGQGAMHDNFYSPNDPVGVELSQTIDLGNVPVLMPTPGTRWLYPRFNCIGPASKEMSRHYWREPLVVEAVHDEDI